MRLFPFAALASLSSEAMQTNYNKTSVQAKHHKALHEFVLGDWKALLQTAVVSIS